MLEILFLVVILKLVAIMHLVLVIFLAVMLLRAIFHLQHGARHQVRRACTCSYAAAVQRPVGAADGPFVVNNNFSCSSSAIIIDGNNSRNSDTIGGKIISSITWSYSWWY